MEAKYPFDKGWQPEGTERGDLGRAIAFTETVDKLGLRSLFEYAFEQYEKAYLEKPSVFMKYLLKEERDEDPEEV